MVVYIDLLLLDNFCADAALLYCAVRTVRGQAKPLRIACTALAGAAAAVGYTLLGLYVSIPPPADFFIKYAVAALLPLPAAKFRRKRTYVLCSLAFLGYMAAFAGVLTALFSADMPAVGEAGLIYTFGGLPSGVLAAACVGFGALAVRLVRALAGQARVAAGCLRCVLVLGEKKVDLRAFADTGNRLRGEAGEPVVVADRAAALALLQGRGLRGDAGGAAERGNGFGAEKGGAEKENGCGGNASLPGGKRGPVRGGKNASLSGGKSPPLCNAKTRGTASQSPPLRGEENASLPGGKTPPLRNAETRGTASQSPPLRGGRIAVHTVSGTAFFPWLRIDRLEIYCGKRANIIEDVTVAVSPRPLAGEYGALLPPEYADISFSRQGRERKRCCKRSVKCSGIGRKR